ncbi:DUF1799 domain-containing protein [Castellaniella sp.]|uniref:DUF1799 domain-containing protein n=1 Tax=Castellaniella sp. TaxID=1955812 RepID=UPI00355FB605
MDASAALGVSTEDFPDVPLWPENVRALDFFLRLSTQWRVGPGGVYGMDYNPVFHELDRAGMSSEEYDELLEDVRVMESAALAAMRD